LPPASASPVRELDGLDLRFRGRCAHPKGAVDLARYPNLVYLKEGGVRTHISGIAVAEIAATVRNGIIGEIEQVAQMLDVSLDELLDAIRYARAQGQV
jgi:hypothetical protein